MRIVLVEPPQADPAQPYTSLSVLLGAWRAAGLEVLPADLNLEYFEYLCNPEIVDWHVRLAKQKLDGRKFRSGDEKWMLQRAVTSGEFLPDAVRGAVGVLKNPAEFYDPARYAWAVRLISRNLEAVSSVYFPGRITLQTFQAGGSHLSSRGILASLEDRWTNPFSSFCEDVARRRLQDLRPDVLAVSVTFQTQIIPAWTLAAWAKEWQPELKIVLGGAAITRIMHKLVSAPHLFRDIDACVFYEGESALPALVEEWQKGASGKAAPNVAVKSGKSIWLSPKRHIEDLQRLPPPDHDGLPMKDYWAPEPAILLNFARGCYWGRCSFCRISPATSGPAGRGYRLRSPDLIVSDLDFVRRQTGARRFNFCVDALPPAALKKISDAILEWGHEITWDTEIRLDRGLDRSVLQRMAKAGCRYLRFGFETASQRVRDLMNKGTSTEVIDGILRNCRNLGITVSLMCQIGFPGETYEESLLTMEYLRNARREVAFISIVPFVLEHGSEVFKKPDKFGIRIHPHERDNDLSWMYHFSGPGEMTDERRNDVYEEIERRLDEWYPDRDLFFKGGLGHSHTTLYAGKFPHQAFIAWNRRPRRSPEDFGTDIWLRTARRLSLTPDEEAKDLDHWTRFVVCSMEVPEKAVVVHGSALLVLSLCATPVPLGQIVRWIRFLYGNQISEPDALAVVRELYEAGLLLAREGDSRTIPAGDRREKLGTGERDESSDQSHR